MTVPEGDDIIGSYFMADGFNEGYFGIQVNSPAEGVYYFLFGVLLTQTIQKVFLKIKKLSF